MGTFSTKKYLNGDPALIPQIAQRIEAAFGAEEYNVQSQSLLSGGYDISLSKGGVFKIILGMKTALKIMLKPQGEGILFDASVGLFGMQVIPTAIMLLVFWPVLVTQIWGLVRQAKLDDKALKIAEEVIRENSANGLGRVSQIAGTITRKFCTACGAELPGEASFCHHCGAKQDAVN